MLSTQNYQISALAFFSAWMAFSETTDALLLSLRSRRLGLVKVDNCQGILIGTHVVATASHCLPADVVNFEEVLPDPDSECDSLDSRLALCTISNHIEVQGNQVLVGAPDVAKAWRVQRVEAEAEVDVGTVLHFVDAVNRKANRVVVKGFRESGAKIVACGQKAVDRGDSGGPVFLKVGTKNVLVGIIEEADGAVCEDGGRRSIFTNITAAGIAEALQEWQDAADGSHAICGIAPSAEACPS